MKRALIPGSFDPVTAGHMDLITRAAAIVDELYVGVFVNPEKQTKFSLEARVSFLKKACAEIKNVHIVSDTGLVVDFARKLDIRVLIKGVRNANDFTYESEMARTNQALAPEIETLFLPADPAYGAISSTMVRQLCSERRPLTGLVPPQIEADLTNA